MPRIGLVVVSVLAAVPALAADFSVADPTPTAAERRVAAVLDLTGGYSWFHDPFGDYHASHFNVAGRINFWLGPRASVQVDAWDEEIDFIPGGDTRFYGGAVHLNMRDPASHLFGVVASVGDAFDNEYANVALEGQRYIGSLTLYAQAGYGWGFASGDGQTMPYVHLDGRFFASPDLMLEGQVGYGRFDNGFATTDVVRWEARVERKLPNMPFAGFVAYQGTLNDSSVGPAVVEHAVLAGLKLLSAESLEANDRAGAGLVDFNPLFGNPTWRF